MLGRVAFGLLLLVCLAESYVDFGSSRVYDEYDFKGNPTVVIDGLCANSCRIFASMTEASRKLCNNLLIQVSKTFYSVGVIAESIDPATNQKLFLEVNKTAALTITNTNANYNAGPVVLYVVDNSDNIRSQPQPEIYEAAVLNRPATAGRPASLTIMSAEPFTVKQAPFQDNKPQGIMAKMRGYDHIDEQSCPYLYFSENNAAFPGFTMEVNGPILSLMWDDQNQHEYPPGVLTASVGITNIRNLELSGWLSSPGYHGCPGKKLYRSSLYDYSTPFHAELSSYKAAAVYVDVRTNTDYAHPVTVVDANEGFEYTFADTPDEFQHAYDFPESRHLTVDWQPTGESTHFLMRWHYGRSFGGATTEMPEFGSTNFDYEDTTDWMDDTTH